MDKEKAKLLVQKVKASILMLQEIEKDLNDFLGEDLKVETFKVEETWLGDNGKEYKSKTPYIKAKQWYCCGKPLEKVVKDGQEVYHCSVCNSNYSS